MNNAVSVKAIEEAVEAALIDFEVFDVYSYGWLNEEDPDPEMIGHAMWQLEMPLPHDTHTDDGPMKRCMTDFERQVMTLGEDFCGLMKASRLSLGLALVWLEEAKRDLFGDASFFWLHRMDAFIKLAIASDRLRDLLIVACTGEDPDRYKATDRKSKLYVTPFQSVETLLSNRSISVEKLTDELRMLAEQAPAIFEYVKRRNEIVHELATRMARFLHDAAQQSQDRYRDEQVNGFKAREVPKDWNSIAEQQQKKAREELDTAVIEIKEWYLLLISASNYVFQIEHRVRTRRS